MYSLHVSEAHLVNFVKCLKAKATIAFVNMSVAASFDMITRKWQFTITSKSNLYTEGRLNILAAAQKLR